MPRMYEFKQKEVINVKDGARFGYVSDVEFSMETGEVEKIIVPGPAKVFGMFGRDEEYRIPWSAVQQIGEDIILIDVDLKKDKILGSDNG